MVISLAIAVSFDSKHQKDKEQCNIDSSYCKVEHICPSSDDYCKSVNNESYHAFLYCEFYTGTYNDKEGYCDFYNSTYTRNYPQDINKYDEYLCNGEIATKAEYEKDPKSCSYAHDQLKQSIKEDIKIIIEKEHLEEEKSYDDKSDYKGRRYNRRGDESQEK